MYTDHSTQKFLKPIVFSIHLQKLEAWYIIHNLHLFWYTINHLNVAKYFYNIYRMKILSNAKYSVWTLVSVRSRQLITLTAITLNGFHYNIWTNVWRHLWTTTFWVDLRFEDTLQLSVQNSIFANCKKFAQAFLLGVNFINVLRTNFLYKHRFGSLESSFERTFVQKMRAKNVDEINPRCRISV